MSNDKRKSRTGSNASRRKAVPAISHDLVVAETVPAAGAGALPLAVDRLTFDGYILRWNSATNVDYDAFSGQPDESAKESDKDLGPIPQGLFAIDPANIENMNPSQADIIRDWGAQRVRAEPYSATVKRMVDCFKLVRTGLYIHGGSEKGTSGCIEINDKKQHAAFFAKLKTYGKKIELEVKYTGARETKYEATACPY
jgi:hypothetical protein